jgi:hypothetical protein
MQKRRQDSESSVRGKRNVRNGKFMSKAKATDPLDRTFTLEVVQKMGAGIRGKYFARVSKGTNLVKLHPEIAKAFPNEDAVNAALASVIEMAKFTTKPRPARRKVSG